MKKMTKGTIKPLAPVAARRPTRIKLPLERMRAVPHNHPLLPTRPTWYLAFGRPGTNSIFCHAGRHRTEVRGSNEGWTLEDARTFGAWLAERNDR